MSKQTTLSVAEKISMLTHQAEYRKYMKQINTMMTKCEERTEIFLFKPKQHTLDYFRADGFSVTEDKSKGYIRYKIGWTYGKA